jgi:hypothetical protein
MMACIMQPCWQVERAKQRFLARLKEIEILFPNNYGGLTCLDHNTILGWLLSAARTDLSTLHRAYGCSPTLPFCRYPQTARPEALAAAPEFVTS